MWHITVCLQVDRYKQLLLKQRDIMIALTGRLNERDEQILTLQEELEAYDAHQKWVLPWNFMSTIMPLYVSKSKQATTA
jgi:hypothetical protein